jgi:hypothetical protein
LSAGAVNHTPVVLPIRIAPQSGTRIAAHSTAGLEFKAPACIIPPIQAGPQIRTKGKILTSHSAPIPKELLDNFAAREYRASS